jgi:hypothetical protein
MMIGGGIDPDTEEEKDVRKKPDVKSNLKGKRKVPSKEAWVTHCERYRALLVSTLENDLGRLKYGLKSVSSIKLLIT